MPNADLRLQVRQNIYYILIFFISLLTLVFLPMIGSTVGLDFNLPTTTAGWIVWAVVKVIVATINVLLYHCFMQQAKLNAEKDDNYKAARAMLQKTHPKEYHPRSPAKFLAQSYGRKGTTIFFSSALSTVALTQAILAFDWISFLVYLFTITMGIIFGVLAMKNAENYWTQEYYDYAVQVVAEQEALKESNKASNTTVAPLEENNSLC